ncbi:MAG: HIT family protein [Cytophagales bacterium]|nr:HIT family protein [Cytophagales bacterium]
MPSLFTRIIQRELPAHIVHENDKYLSILDINPLKEGHSLVIPKHEIDDIFEQPDQVLKGLLPFAKEVAQKIKKVIPCQRIGVSVIGLEVPHTHVHLIPINTIYDMDIRQDKPKFSPQDLEKLAERLRAA